MDMNKLPLYHELTHRKGMPTGCAWGLWDKDGQRDQHGTLNLLTPDNTKRAREEIQEGISISLNLPIQTPQPPAFGRQVTSNHIKRLDNSLDGYDFITHEDVLHFNTQASSQWDGFKHWPHQDSKTFYNGQTAEEVPESTDNGIHHWHERGCIVGRGVLIDYARYAERHGIQYDIPTQHRITAGDLKKAAAEQGTEIRPADVLIVRVGWTKWYNALSSEQREKEVGEGYRFAGVSADEEETIPWLWNSHFSAVASDTIAFETCPPSKIHDHCLGLWGMPIGELWDLEELSRTCEKLNRWSFFLTSAPLNVVGGVASPPNVLAIL